MSLSLTNRANQSSIQGRQVKYASKRVLVYLVAIGGALIMTYPLLWMITASFKPEDTIFSNPSIWSSQWIINSYTDGWNALLSPFSVYLTNSLLVCVMAIIGNVLSASMAAYAFARLKFRWKPLWFVVMQGTILLPTHVMIVPQYILFKYLGWLDTLLPLFMPKFFAVDAFFIFLMIQFMRSIPLELDEAAKIDGCGRIRFYWNIMMPLSLPALVTTAIFTFIWTWGDFFAPLIYIKTDTTYTVPLALSTFLDSTGVSAYGQLFAMSVLSLVPIFVFFLCFQRLLIEGASSSGIKG
jgi:multiple sugar transport system permease protein